MTGAAKQCVADFPVGDGLLAGLAPGGAIPNVQDASLLLNIYEQRFLPAVACDTARVNFRQAFRKEGESIIAWSARLCLLHSRAYPNMPTTDQETNTDLIEAFVICLSNKVMVDRVWNRRPDTHAAALYYANDAAASKRILNQPVPQQPPSAQPSRGAPGATALGATRLGTTSVIARC